jgi:hypothetical protein
MSTLIRTLRALATGNLLLAIAVVGAYFICGLILQLDIDQGFLGWKRFRLGRASGGFVPAYTLAVFFHSALLIGFIAMRKMERDVNALRGPCLESLNFRTCSRQIKFQAASFWLM